MRHFQLGPVGAFCLALCAGACHRGAPSPVRVPVLGEGYDTTAIDATALADDFRLRRRVLNMTWREVAGRLGSLRFSDRAVVTVLDSNNTVINEQTQVSDMWRDNVGSLHLRKQSPPHVFEVIVREDKCFVRQDHGFLRRKSPRDMDIEDIFESGYQGLAGVLKQFKHVTLTEGTPSVVQGREVSRYNIGLGHGAPPRLDVGAQRLSVSPPPKWRLEAGEAKLSGTIAVDHETGVVIAANVAGDVEMGRERLKLRYQSRIEQVGRVATIAEPSDSMAEYRRPIRPRDPLNFLKKSALHHDATRKARLSAEDEGSGVDVSPDALEGSSEAQE